MSISTTQYGDEHGAVAIIVGIFSVGMFAFAAYAVDAGHLWETRRNVITATDAAALASAGVYAVGGDGCAGTDDDYVSNNLSDATVASCTTGGLMTTSGYVTVVANAPVDYVFAQILGVADRQVGAQSTAEYGKPSGVGGLRPFGLCFNNSSYVAWQAAGFPTPSAIYRITYNKSNPSDCAGVAVPGNWGVMDFDGGANSNADTQEWTANGYPGQISIGQIIEGDTGAFSNSLDSELSSLIGKEFTIPLFDQAEGNGANATFRVYAFVGVKLLDYKTTGNQGSRYMELQFTRLVTEGVCCDPSAPDTGLRVVRICAFDGTSLTDC